MTEDRIRHLRNLLLAAQQQVKDCRYGSGAIRDLILTDVPDLLDEIEQLECLRKSLVTSIKGFLEK